MENEDTLNRTSSDETISSSDTEEDQYPDAGDDDNEQETGLQFASLKIATVTCLHKYATVRMEGAESGLLPWPPLMLVALAYLNRIYKRRELVTERNIAMLELLLKVPVQAYIRRGDEIVDLNDDNSLDYSGMSFVESLEILRDLLEANIITQDQIRVTRTIQIKPQ